MMGLQAYLRLATRVVLVLAVTQFIVFSGGCVTAMDAARTSIATTSVALRRTDVVATRIAEEQRGVQLAQAMSFQDYRERMQVFEDVLSAMRTAKASLFALQAALDGVESLGMEQFLEAAGCLIAALGDVLEALEVAGITVPDELTEAAHALEGLAPLNCRPPATTHMVTDRAVAL